MEERFAKCRMREQPGRGARETCRCRDQENHSRHQWHHQADHAERDHHPTQTEVDDPHQTCRPSVASSKDRSLPVDALAGHRLLHGRNEMERVKGIEPSYSAWKSSNFCSVFNTHSDILQLFGRLRSLQNFSLSEWCDERFPSLWKSVQYGRQRLYQQNGASTQHAGTHDEQGEDLLPKDLVAGDVIRIWHLSAPAFFV
jgi:hypothetical protein